MECPQCKAGLVNVMGHALPLDVCPKCGGVWFDVGELGELLDTEVSENPSIPNAPIHLSSPSDRGFYTSSQTAVCSRCRATMRAINFAYDSNVFVQRCFDCGGTWTTRDQICRLAVYLKGNPKLDRLAGSLAEHVAEVANQHDNLDTVGDVRQNILAWMFLPKIILPLGDDVERSITPLATLGLIATNIIVFVLVPTYVPDYDTFVDRFGLDSSRLVEGYASVTLITHLFLHANGYHLIGNMFFLWIFGDNVEEAFGRTFFLLSYLLSGAVAALCQVVADAHSALHMVGSSGAVIGIMGAYFIFYPKAGVRTFVVYRVITVPALVFIGAWFLTQFLYGAASYYAGAFFGVAYFAHVGGLVCGAVLALTYRTYKSEKTA